MWRWGDAGRYEMKKKEKIRKGKTMRSHASAVKAEWLIDTESFRSAVQVVTAEAEASEAPCKYAQFDG